MRGDIVISKYLSDRAEKLSKIIKTNRNKYEHNQIVILESNKKIDDLDHVVDEASEIFSIKVREDSDIKKYEIKDLETKIAAYVIENQDLSKKINEAEEELNIINQCLKELNASNVSRETFEEEKDRSDVSRETLKEESKIRFLSEKDDEISMREKLILCRDIAELDGKRVKIELDNIIRNMD